MPNRTDTNLPIILKAVEAKLIADAVYNSDTVFIGLAPDDNKLMPNIDYCLITPRPHDQIDFEDNLVKGSFTITIWNRLYLDQGQRSDVQIAGVGGTGIKMNKVFGSLNQFDPIVSAQWILAEPMRFVSQTDITLDQDWAKAEQTYSIKYGYDPTLVWNAPAPDNTCGTGSFSCEFSPEFN